MDAALLQDRIYSGYAKAALRIGTSHDIYRATTAINPIDQSNLVGNLLVGIDQNYTYEKPEKYTDQTWQILADGRLLQTFDYLVGARTYFICSMSALLPILVNECNRTVTIARPYEANSGGYTGYSGYLPSTATILMQNCPATILEGTKGEASPVGLPTSVKMPYLKMFLPFLGNVNLKIGDIVEDEFNQRYAITSNERTDMGWRLMIGNVGG